MVFLPRRNLKTNSKGQRKRNGERRIGKGDGIKYGIINSRLGKFIRHLMKNEYF